MKSISNHSFDYKMLSLMGIDSRSSELLKFVIDQNNLNIFDENEHFYYWVSKEEKSFVESHEILKLCKNKELLWEYGDKSYDVSKFDGIASLIVENNDHRLLIEIFSNNWRLFHEIWKKEFILRYSKKYKNIEFFRWYSTIEKFKNRDRFIVKHSKTMLFKINDRGFVYIYPNGRIPRYISNKNALHYCPPNNSPENEYSKKINRRLLNHHLKADIYRTDEEFTLINPIINRLGNKFFSGCKNMNDALMKATKDRPVPKILFNKMDLGNLIVLYNLVEYDEVDKIIKFLYDYWEFLVTTNGSLSAMDAILNYLFLKFNTMVVDREKKMFVYNQKPILNTDVLMRNGIMPIRNATSSQEIRDYVSISLQLGKKINTKIKSLKRLMEEHDRVSRLVVDSTVPQIKVSKKYPDIQNDEGFIIEKIADKKRLCLESSIQKHCVKTYASVINSGKSCIYSFLDVSSSLRYTIEVKSIPLVNKKQLFVLNQIKGKFNSNPSNSVMERVDKTLIKNNVFSNRKSIPQELLSMIKKEEKSDARRYDAGDLPF